MAGDAFSRLIPRPKGLRVTQGACFWDCAREAVVWCDRLGKEAYRLKIEPDSIQIEASTERGIFYARQTLAQLKRLAGESCPCLEIEDEPLLSVRGYMLDISRCRVPRMSHFFRIVDLLAFFKFNQLQLYMEHPFAYTGHEHVWKEASPMTAEEIRELDLYCKNRYIELVPNQNAFGHMERWLRHEPYKQFAECPDGFEHPLSGWKSTGSVLAPDSASLSFVDKLLNELLPNFSSGWVHLGCDEPWELGQGRSRERIERDGRHAVFLEYLKGLHDVAQRHGKRMLFWSDELQDQPDRIKDFPPALIPVAWGYEANHDFRPECAAFSEAGYSFLVAPGDSSWNSFTGRLTVAKENIKNASRLAHEYGAMGLLFTSWGDQGHQQCWPTQLCGIILAGEAAWSGGSVDEERIGEILDVFVFYDKNRVLGGLLVELSLLDEWIPYKLFPVNSSFPYDAIYADSGRIKSALGKGNEKSLAIVLERLDGLNSALGESCPTCDDAEWLLDEIRLAIEMSRYGLRRARAIQQGRDEGEVFAEWPSCLEKFARAWQQRSREGGLAESLERLRTRRVPGHLRAE